MLASRTTPVLGRQHRFDVARVLVGRVAGQAARDLDRALGEDGDAVEGLLPVRRDVVAELLDLSARELLVRAFELLQAEGVRALFFEIGEEMAEPLADRIHVPCGDAQGVLLAGTAS